MYLIYTDDSGSPDKTSYTKYFCLSAVIVCERDWNDIEIKINEIKSRYSLPEIHTRNLFRRKKEFVHIKDDSQVCKIIGEIYSLISKFDITLISSIIDKKKFYDQYYFENAEFKAWEHLVERIDMCIGQLRNKNNNYYENGLIITDNNSSKDHDNIVRSYLQMVRYYGTRFHKIKYVIEDPLFSVSKWRNLIQIADSIAYCSVQYLLNEPFFVGQFQTIQHKFDKKKGTGDIFNYGFKVFPK